MVDDPQYEFISVQVIRGTEGKTIAKWEKDGWELDARSQGLLRTEMTFRRVKPTTLGSRIRAASVAWCRHAADSAHVGCGGPLYYRRRCHRRDAGWRQRFPVDRGDPAAGTERTPPQRTAPGSDERPHPFQRRSRRRRDPDCREQRAVRSALGDQEPGVPLVGAFAAEYHGRTIEFDGSIAAMGNHGDCKTRYDLLVGAGDFSATTSSGPNFQFHDVNITSDLHLNGLDIPDTIGIGDTCASLPGSATTTAPRNSSSSSRSRPR